MKNFGRSFLWKLGIDIYFFPSEIEAFQFVRLVLKFKVITIAQRLVMTIGFCCMECACFCQRIVMTIVWVDKGPRYGGHIFVAGLRGFAGLVLKGRVFACTMVFWHSWHNGGKPCFWVVAGFLV